MVIDKDESRRICKEIRQVLLRVWDPIGIHDEPNAQDEYDSYLGDIYNLLLSGATDKEISNHLCQIIEKRMGLHPITEQMKARFEPSELFQSKSFKSFR